MKVAIVDTETTGVAVYDEPISVGVLLVEIEASSGKLIREIRRYHGWREPRVVIHPKAQAVHGKTAADLAGKVLDLVTITSLINEADVLVAHNAQFDARKLSVVCDVASSKAWRCSLQQFPWPAAAIGRKKLDSVCEFYGIARPDCHDALADCEALLAVLLIHTGKTTRSRTFLALLLAKAPLGFDLRVRVAEPRTLEYRPSSTRSEPRRPDRLWDEDPFGFEPPRRRGRRTGIGVGEAVVWGVLLMIALVIGLATHS
jgi:DNA polymerase III subunit epsilon